VPPNFHRLQRIAETVAMHTVTGPVDLQAVADALAADEAETAAREITATSNGTH
jgi:hypothetical protein